MDSCFPPFGALSLKDSRKSLNVSKEYNSARRSISGAPPTVLDDEDETNHNGKIEILQDLDLYYIRQIAHNLKVRWDNSFIDLFFILVITYADFFKLIWH